MRQGKVAATCVALLAACAMACTGAGDPAAAPTSDAAALSADMLSSEAATQPDDVVDLTVYFRSGTGSDAHLVPTVREVSVSDDLPREALALLLDGPAADDGQGLASPLPTSTELLDLSVVRGTAVVDLSGEAIADADSVGASPENETLALGAVANTLTEFPFIDQVRIEVEGRTDGPVAEFWGGWGLPALLVRDDSLIGPTGEGEGVLDLSRFVLETQTVGAADAAPVEVTSVQARPRTTYLRLAVQLAYSADPSAVAEVPSVRAVTVGDEIVLEIGNVAAYSADFALGQRIDVRDPEFSAIEIEPADLPGRLRIVVRGLGPPAATPVPGDVPPDGLSGPPPGAEPEARPFWLHTLSSPTRVVLDVRK